MSDLDPSLALDDPSTDDGLVQAVMAQAQPTKFELALLRHIRRLESQLEAALNDLTALHAGKKRQIALDNWDEAPTALTLKVLGEEEDEAPTLH